MTFIRVRAPASSANLGPGFDCLGLALDLWNQAEFSLEGQRIQVQIDGEGQGRLPEDDQNPVVKAAQKVYEAVGKEFPTGISIRCENQIPLGSGLGSSASAALLGLIGANCLLGKPLSQKDILRLGTEIEGHPDNVAPALLGGLVISTRLESGEVLARQVETVPLSAIIAVPEFDLPTRAARETLPPRIAFADAVFNVGNTALLVEAFRKGDWDLLGKAMRDRLHQPYRMRLIPGAERAMQAGLSAGARGAALSGAGPGIIAFTPTASGADLSLADEQLAIQEAMLQAFQEAGLPGRGFILSLSNLGSWAAS